MSERAVFVRSLFGTLKPGHILVMGGKAKSEAQEIDIRLCNKERNSIDLRLLIRFENNQIVRNTRTNRRWGAEEIEENLEPNACLNPITPGAHFRLYILLETSKFRIAFDGKPFCTYAYRLPLEGICAFSVSYGVEKITQLDHRQVYPSPWPPIQMDEPNLSFSADFPIQFSPGHCIYIAGTCSENSAGQFVIFFVDGSSNPSKKLSFYFNQRCASQIVALNIATNIAHGDLQ
ncbi:galectin-9-like [Phlebotomus argentipes]|uniref:galectin-9-like n=1 Tax=Phlebotomus argentipes TaxID=94469 RepID=UPI0028931A91|nr:galectin-9-like [Phlebotomus argentipes]